MHTPAATGKRLVAYVCLAQTLAQIGAYFWPALLPTMMPVWGLNYSEAGWITAAFYAAYMASVPVLVTLTDRVNPKFIYLLGVGCTVVGHVMFGLAAEGFWSAMAWRALAGIGWAGTYMTGIKLISDHANAKLLSRAVAGHAASIGISGALSFACAGLLADAYGWRTAFVIAGLSALIAWIIVFFAAPGGKSSGPKPVALFDFRPVLRNRSSMSYSLAYCIHTLEMNALRGWGVAFLGYVALSTDVEPLFSPIFVMTALGLIGTVASVLGNETAIRFGRRRLVCAAMAGSVVVGGSLGYLGTLSYLLAVGLLLVYGFVVWLDSSSLTAGAAGTATPDRRGATLAVHSSLGYAGGFVGPLVIGFALDWSGGMSRSAWGASFLAVAALMALAMAVFVVLKPDEIHGERGR